MASLESDEALSEKVIKNVRLATLLESLCKDSKHLTKAQFLGVMVKHGVQPTDTRVVQTMLNLAPYGPNDPIEVHTFVELVRDNTVFVERLLQGHFVIAKFDGFVNDIRAIFNETAKNNGGQVASYIPQLGRVSPEKLGLAVTTVDGQQMSLGDSDEGFCVQSTSKVSGTIFKT